ETEIKSVMNENDNDFKQTAEQIDEREQIKLADKVRDPEQTKREIQPSNQSHNNQRRNKKEQSLKDLPYNVMMTPRDNRNLTKKKKQNNIHNQEQMNGPASLPPHYLLNDKAKQSSQDQLWVKNQQQL